MTRGRSDQHLEEQTIAAYVDGAVPAAKRGAIEAHLAACLECRTEVAEVSRVVGTMPAARPRRIWLLAATAAAAVVLVALWPRTSPEPDRGMHREEAVTITVAPRPLAPLNAVRAPRALVWSSAQDADRYRVRLFDVEGTVLWDRETTDTVAALPDSLGLRAGASYYWKVEAHSGFDRWTASDLVEFTDADRERP